MVQLERYEWCDYWWGETNEREKERVLLIGDSITRGYRPFVGELLKEKACVDMLATSKAVDNPSFLREIQYIVNHGDFKYGVIHINNGLHGWHLTADEYERSYDRVLGFLSEIAGAAKIILALSTPVTVPGAPAELEAKTNGQVLARNAAAERLARRYGFAVHDLYTPMAGRSEYRVNDGYHYNAEGQRAQAGSVVKAIDTEDRTSVR